MIVKSLRMLAIASKGSPVTSLCAVYIMYLFFNVVEAGIEKLIFGERFEHWLDIGFAVIFISYGIASILACAEYNSKTP